VIFALSIHSFVTRIGAYAGFAAVIGLALLAILLFAQARELRQLREWGAHAHDRIGELERRLAAALELARRAGASQRTMAPGARAAGGPAPPHVGAPAAGRRAGTHPAARGPVAARTSAPTRPPLLPAAPVGVAGAALGSATMLVPPPEGSPGVAPPAPGAPAPAAMRRPEVAQPTVAAPALAAEAVAAESGPAPAPARAPAPAPAPPAPATAAAAASVPAAPAPAPAPAPAAAPSATNGHSDTFPPVPPVRRAVPPAARAAAGRRPPARGRPGAPAARPGARPAAAAPLRARGVASATPRAAAADGARTAGGARRRVPLLAGIAAVVVLAVIAVVVLSSGGGTTGAQSASSTGATPRHAAATHGTAPPAAAPAHDRVTVAVLNGTATQGLANTIATTLTNAGFVRGPVGNASDQQRSVTVVSYFGGHEADAKEVAKTLNVPADAVQPIDADTEAACARSTGSCAVPVVVTAGADRG